MKRSLARALSVLAGLAAVACGGAPPVVEPLPPPPPSAPSAQGAGDNGGVDRSKLPAPGPAISWAPPMPSSWQLENGVKVLVAQSGSTPVLSVHLMLPRGAAYDPKGKAGLTHLMADLLDEGAGKFSALQLSEELQLLATDLSMDVGVDYLLLSLDLLAENFGRSVELLADIVQRPQFSREEFVRTKERLTADAINREADPGSAQRAARLDVLFGDGYAGDVPEGTQASLKNLTLADVKRQYKELLVPAGATFVVSGLIAKDTIQKELARTFGAWKGAGNAKPRAVVPEPKAGPIYWSDFPGAAQSVVSLVRRAPGATAEDYFTTLVFNRAWGGAFTGRLNMNLREDKGYTYGARSGFLRYREAGFFAASASVRSDATRPSIDEMIAELEGVCGPRPLSAEEHAQSVSGILLGYPGEFETARQFGWELANVAIFDRPLDWLQTYPANVQAVTLEQANVAAMRYCAPQEFSIVIAGDRDKFEKDLTSLGRPIVGYDHAGQRLD